MKMINRLKQFIQDVLVSEYVSDNLRDVVLFTGVVFIAGFLLGGLTVFFILQ